MQAKLQEMHRTKWTETKWTKTKWVAPGVMPHLRLCIFLQVEIKSRRRSAVWSLTTATNWIIVTGKDCWLADSGKDLPGKTAIR
jgi:hypothetical protein